MLKSFTISLIFLFGALFANYVSMSVVTIIHDEFPRDPLPDLGHRALPDLWVGKYTLLTFLVALWFTGCCFLLTTHIHVLLIYTRISLQLGIMFLMRAFSILVTIQPSPYGHLEPPPTSTWFYALDYRNIFTSSGDNMFSAHTMFLTVPYLAISTYLMAPFSYLHIGMSVAYGSLVFWIIASHLHYTADVLISLYLCFSIWSALRSHFSFKKRRNSLDETLRNLRHSEKTDEDFL
jgi:hypothetical protein